MTCLVDIQGLSETPLEIPEGADCPTIYTILCNYAQTDLECDVTDAFFSELGGCLFEVGYDCNDFVSCSESAVMTTVTPSPLTVDVVTASPTAAPTSSAVVNGTMSPTTAVVPGTTPAPTESDDNSGVIAGAGALSMAVGAAGLAYAVAGQCAVAFMA